MSDQAAVSSEQPATWQDVAAALAQLEQRQAAMRGKLSSLQSLSSMRAEAMQRLKQQNARDENGLRLAYAARAAQMQRQSRALVSQALRAGRQAQRSRSLAARATATAQAARSELGDVRGALRGLEAALDAKSREAQRHRCECSRLAGDLRHLEQKAAADALRLTRQDLVLDESARLLRHFIGTAAAAPQHSSSGMQTDAALES